MTSYVTLRRFPRGKNMWFWILLLKGSKRENFTIATPEIESEKSTKSAIRKSTYGENFKSFAQKLWFWRTNRDLFFRDTLYTSDTIRYGKIYIHLLPCYFVF